MEEASSHIFKFDDIKPILNNQQVNYLPICLSKSKIKAMHGRIFWCRNNSQGSLQKIKDKQKQQSPDKLKQYRQNNEKLKEKLDDLVKKLCLPKIKESSSLHTSCVRHTHQRKQTTHETIINRNVVKQQPSSYIPKSKIKQKINGRKQVNQILNKYQKRCQQQIQQFTLISVKNSKLFTEPYNIKKSEPAKHRFSTTNDVKNQYVPKAMLKSLIKNIR